MRIAIRRIGNSKAIIIPAALLEQVGLDTEAEVLVEEGALVLRAPSRPVRDGWAAASQQLAAAGDAGLALPEFPNDGDRELVW